MTFEKISFKKTSNQSNSEFNTKNIKDTYFLGLSFINKINTKIINTLNLFSFSTSFISKDNLKSYETFIYIFIILVFQLFRVASSAYLLQGISTFVLDLRSRPLQYTILFYDETVFLFGILAVICLSIWLKYRLILQENHFVAFIIIAMLVCSHYFLGLIFNSANNIRFVIYYDGGFNYSYIPDSINYISRFWVFYNLLFFLVLNVILFSNIITHHNDLLLDTILSKITASFKLRENTKMMTSIINIISDFCIFSFIKYTELWSYGIFLCFFLISQVFSVILALKLFNLVNDKKYEKNEDKDITRSLVKKKDEDVQKIYSMYSLLEHNARLLFPLMASFCTFLICIYITNLRMIISSKLSILHKTVTGSELNIFKENTKYHFYSYAQKWNQDFSKIKIKIVILFLFNALQPILQKIFLLFMDKENANKYAKSMKAISFCILNMAVPIFFTKTLISFRRAQFKLFAVENILENTSRFPSLKSQYTKHEENLLKCYKNFQVFFEEECVFFNLVNHTRMALGGLTYLGCLPASKSYTKAFQEYLEIIGKGLFGQRFTEFHAPHNFSGSSDLIILIALSQVVFVIGNSYAMFMKLNNPIGFADI